MRDKAEKKRKSTTIVDVAGQWDEKQREMATWASDQATLHLPNSKPPTPQSIKEPSLALCSALHMTPLCKTNSPAIPLALLRGATTILKGPEVVALQSLLVHLRVQNVCDR